MRGRAGERGRTAAGWSYFAWRRISGVNGGRSTACGGGCEVVVEVVVDEDEDEEHWSWMCRQTAAMLAW